MFVFINKAVARAENRIKANFSSAVHVIENLNISDNTVTAQVRVYADLVALKYDFNPAQVDGGKVIYDRHFSYPRKSVQDYMDANPDLPLPETSDPFIIMKASVANYMVGHEAGYEEKLLGFEDYPEVTPSPQP